MCSYLLGEGRWRGGRGYSKFYVAGLSRSMLLFSPPPRVSSNVIPVLFFAGAVLLTGFFSFFFLSSLVGGGRVEEKITRGSAGLILARCV